MLRYKTLPGEGRKVLLNFIGIEKPRPYEYTLPNHNVINPEEHLPGMRAIYTSAEELEEKINEYFESCNGNIYDKFGQLILDKDGEPVIKRVIPYTISGLAMHLGIATSTLRKYEKLSRQGIINPYIAIVILKARQKIESFAEGMVYTRDGSNGAQFVLRTTFGWATKKEQVDITNALAKHKQAMLDLQIKRKLFLQDVGNDGDNEITINITRARRDKDD